MTYTRFILSIGILYLCLSIISPAQSTAQQLVRGHETATFTEYILKNDSLKADHAFDIMIPVEPGTTFDIIEQRVVRTELENGGNDLNEAYSLYSDSRPVVEVLNPGVHRGQHVSTLRIHAARFDENNPEIYQVTQHLKIRVPKFQQNRVQTRALSVQSENSPFESGDWFKIAIPENGIYEIDSDYLSNLGLSPSNIDPEYIQIWGSPGYELPRVNSAPRHTLQELPVYFEGSANGQFNTTDAIIFYGNSPHQIIRDSETNAFIHQQHRYSDFNYVFLTVGTEPGKRLSTETEPSPPSRTITTFRDFIWKEEDLFKSEDDFKSGIEWFGQRFSSSQQQSILQGTYPGILPNQDLDIEISVVGRSTQSMSFNFFLDQQQIGSANVFSITDYNSTVGLSGRMQSFTTTVNRTSGSDNINLSANINFSAPNSQGFIHWIRLSLDRELIATNNYLYFYAPLDGSAGEMVQYQLQGFNQPPIVMDITDPQNPLLLESDFNQGQTVLTAHSEPNRRFIAQSDFYTPEPGTAISNQNLKGVNGYPEYIIITSELFRSQAEEWAQYRSNSDGFETLVVTQSEIFNEFSAGIPDVTAIRDFMKYLYDRGMAAGGQMPEHLLLFGDASYDFKGINNNPLANHVFTFQSDESLHRINSYGSDDYFGLLDDDEGAWLPNDSSERIDIGIGRFPVQTPDDAEVLMEKIRIYENTGSTGLWRSLFTFSSDDDFPEVDRNRDLHLLNADGTAQQIDKNETGLQVSKIHMLSYPVETTAGGRRVPGATRDFIDAINRGTLVLNYSGHGNEQVLADERLFTSEMIPQFTNRNRPSIFVTATCQFGRYDDDEVQSGAEKSMLWPNGGMVATFTTTRVVFTSSTAGSNNFGLNIQLTRQMVERTPDGAPQRLGDIYMRTKNTSQGSGFNARKFILLGDPAMRIGLPEKRAQVSEINGVDLAEHPDTTLTIRALDQMHISGLVTNHQGVPLYDLNGEVNIRVFDAERTVNLPDKDWVIDERCFMPDCQYQVENDILFNGRASVQDGQFQSSFIVPKDISFSENTGRILIYAEAENTDGSGSFNRVNFDGINEDAAQDTEGPEMDAYLNDQNFVNGNLVNSSPTLIVELEDESGINTTGIGVGHEITATIDTQPRETFVLNDFYTSNLDDFRGGRIEYPLQELQEGSYSLTVRAWDVHNNPAEKNIFFEVADSERLEVRNVYNYPNPMNNFTRFVIEHNQPGNLLEMDVRIFTLSGRPVTHLQESQISSNSYAYIEWNGLDRDHDRLANGTYIYVLRVRADTPQGRQTKEKIEKLVIIR